MIRRFAVLFVMLAVLALLFWAGVHNLRARRAALARNQIQLAPASASSEEAAPDDALLRLKGKPAPGFTLTGVDGKKVSLSQFKGHPVMVNFWATWCGPCKLEMPWIEEFSQKYKSQGFVVLGLSQDTDLSLPSVESAAHKIGVSYPVFLSDEKIARAYGGLDYLPETVYVDKGGKVLDVWAGDPTKDQMEAKIQQTIAAAGE